jgi:hypothetical protein
MSAKSIATKSPSARLFLAALACATMLAAPALAQDASAPSAALSAPSDNATINLINLLVQRGVLKRGEADGLIAQAQAQAEQVRAANQAAQTAQASAQTAQTNSQTAIAAASPASAQPGTSVRYVPQFVRDQIRDEVRNEVLADARNQGLVAPDAMPDWVRRIRLTGDLRLRDEARLFDKGNEFGFVNIAAINAGLPYNTDPATNPVNPPIMNTLRNRNYLRLRARIGIEADIDPGITAYFRLATGEQNSPVSTNRTLGGFFSGKDIWLDRAYIDAQPVKGAHLYLGRMANPFRLSELVWDDDVNLDGVAASYERPVGGGLSLFALAGAFPLDYVPDDSPATATADQKTSASKDKYLFAGQFGATFKASDSLGLSVDAAYYRFQNVEGDLSPACSNVQAFCFTDYSRPFFSQKGNTLFALRDIVTVDPTNTANPQYYGLASKFQILAASAALDWTVADGLALRLSGNYSKNLGYDEAEVLARGFNAKQGISQIVSNNETCTVAVPVGKTCTQAGGSNVFLSGDTAWLVRATIGSPDLTARGNWQVSGSYRHIDPDALLDAFTDSDFRLGGTNAKGWTLEGSYALLPHTVLGLRWLSANEVSGPPLRVDSLLTDITVKF